MIAGSRVWMLGVLFFLFPGQVCLAQPDTDADIRVTGSVRDSTGAVVSSAEVIVTAPGFRAVRWTNADGSFVVEHVPAISGSISARAPGFARIEQPWRSSSATIAVELTLMPATVAQSVTVTAARTEAVATESTAPVTVLSRPSLSSSGALTLDDTLRQVAGLSLFRRSGSLTANPTSQGVSLRGLGASGASRALVISDSIPLNDPFGGWVYWDRIPLQEIASVEVSTGGASPLYGSDALGGVINIIRKPVSAPALSLETSYGNANTPDLSLFASQRVGQWAGGFGLDSLHTDGYIAVDPAQRGAVDTPVASEHLGGDLTFERLLGNAGRVFLRGSSFGENRENGTPLQTNRTTVREFDLGADWRSDALGSFSVAGYGGYQVFHQSFSAIAADRNSENLTRTQRVPAQQVGVSGQWSRAAGTRHMLVAGAEAYEVRGEGSDLVFLRGVASTAVAGGGRQRDVGAFFEDLIRITPRWLLTPTVRVDHWRNFGAFTSTQALPVSAPANRTVLPETSETFFSPRLGTLVKLTGALALTGAAYRSFRAPTLNELYRSFRVGNIVTLNNSQLEAERLTGGEAGAIYNGLRDRLSVRGTFFWSEITRPIANVTLSVTPTLITRQRQNLGRTRSRGMELAATASLTPTVSLSGGYQFADATVASFRADPALVGLEIPQVPRHQFTLQARYSKRSVTAAVQARYVGTQFEDDLNQLPLDGYFTMDALVSHSLGNWVEVFAAAQNLLNQRYDIGRTPVRTIAAPVLARVGIRLQLHR